MAPAALTTAALTMNNARSIATDAIPPARGSVALKRETRSVSPNACPRKPSCPTASEPSRSASMRPKEIPWFSRGSVRRHAQVLTMCETPASAITSPSPHPRVAMLSRSLPGPARCINHASSRTPRSPAARRATTGVLSRNPFMDQAPSKDSFRIGQSFRGVDVLPLRAADFHRAQAPLPRQSAHAVGQ